MKPRVALVCFAWSGKESRYFEVRMVLRSATDRAAVYEGRSLFSLN